MSARAAWRLESLGFANVYRYTAGKSDWFASGLPRAGTLAGFLTAISLVKPGKTLAEVDARSVLKKMKDKGFARSVSREDIVLGAEELGRPLEEHVDFVVRALQRIASRIDP